MGLGSCFNLPGYVDDLVSSLELVVVIPLVIVLHLCCVMSISVAEVVSGLASNPAMVTCSRPITSLGPFPVTGLLSVPRLAVNLIPNPVSGLLAEFLAPYPVLGLLFVFLVSRPHVDGLWCEACLEGDM